MKGKRRFAAAILAAALCLGLFLPQPAQAADLYFTGLNDSVAQLTTSTMPFWYNGTLYVPYSVFDPRLVDIHIDLGLLASYSRSSNTVTIYNTQQMLTFDLSNGTCRDEKTGDTYTSLVIVLNGRPYLDVAFVCQFFGLQYSYSSVPYVSDGYLVRIKSADAFISDSLFIDSAKNLINRRLREYNQSLNPSDPSTPATSPGTNPGTSPGAAQAEQPPSPTNIPTYLAVRCETADGLSNMLTTLDAAGCRAVFFLTPQLLERERELVRRILGTGHSVGILAQGGDAGESQFLLERGNRALEEQLHTRTTLAYVPQEQVEPLAAEGWVCWNETLLLSPSSSVGAGSFASTALNRLNSRVRTTYLTLEGGSDGARVLPSLLRLLNEEHFIFNIPLETML